MQNRLLMLIVLVTLPLLTITALHAAETPTQIANQKQNQAEKNKALVIDFYKGVFEQHQVKTYADRYIDNQYIQHNPHVSDGKIPFVNYFTQYFQENSTAQSSIKRVAAEGDLVWLHVHSKENTEDLGTAVIDIFRVEKGKIVEHWDVQQDVPQLNANQNTMF